MDDFTLNKVIEAIELFSDGKQGMKQAEEYLKQFSQQYKAWTICIQGLALDHHNTVTFHLLRTLKQKIRYDFVSLTDVEVKEVYQSSLMLVQKYHSSDFKPIRISSALILIYLYIYTFENQNQRLQDYLQNLSPRFIFDVLELFPEELTQEKTLVIENKKTKLIIDAIKNQQLFPCLELLQHWWNNSQDYHYQILRTYKKWLQFIKGTFSQAERQQFLQLYQNCPIYLGALKAITNEELQQKAVEVLCNFVSLIPKAVAQSYQFENNVGQSIMNEIYKSFKDCQKALEDDLPDEIEQYIKLYTKVGRKFIHTIILNVPEYIEAMLKIFADSKTDEFIEYMTQFWIKFIKTIQSINDQQIKDKYNMIYLQLIECAMIRSKITKEQLSMYETEDYSSKIYEDKQTNRHEMKDLMDELSYIIQPNIIINVFVKFIKTGFVDTQFSQDGICLFEACMNLINGMINQIIVLNDQQSFKFIIELLKLYIQLNLRHDFVTRTVFKTIIKGGALLVQPILSPIFDFISKDILSPNKRLQKRATKAFEKICYENQQFVQENLEDFLKLLDKLQSIQHFEKLVKGIANAVCCNSVYMSQYYMRLCSVFASNLVVLQTEYQKAASQNQSIEHIITQISKNLNSLAQIAGQIPQERESEEYTDQHQIVFSVYQQLWPILQFFIENLSIIDHNIAEKIVRFTKHTFRGSFNSFNKELLKQVFQVMCQAYLNTPISSFIYIAEVSVTVFYKYEEYREILSIAFESLCNITFQHLPKLQSFEDHPDLTEDFFGMLVRFGRYTPQVLLQSEALVILLNLTLNAVGIEHIEAAKSYYAWLEVLFKMLDENSTESFKTPITPELRSKLRSLLITIIPSLLSKLFEALRKGPSDEDVEDYIIDCFIALQKIDFQNYKILLANVLEEGPQNLLTRIEKQDWIQSPQEKQFLKLYTSRSLMSKLRS